MAKGSLTPEQQTQADELRDEKGWGDRRIAAYMGVGRGAVQKDRLRRYPQGFDFTSTVKLEELQDLGLIEPPTSGMKTLIYDIETAPTMAWVWSNWKTNVIDTVQDWYMLCFVYKWEGSDEIGFVSLVDNPEFVPNAPDDLWVARRLAALFDAADVTVAHNGDRFDRRKANARFILNGIDQPSPYQTVDTKKIAAREFMFNSNSLNNLAKYFHLDGKVQHTGFDMWVGCMNGDEDAWDLMMRYNVQDVKLLETIYLKLRPWAGLPGKPLQPNKLHFTEDNALGCPKCGSNDVIFRGHHRTAASVYPTIKCLDCGGYSRHRNRVKGTRQVQ